MIETEVDIVKEVGLEYAKLGWEIRAAIDDYIRRKQLGNSPENILAYLRNHKIRQRGY